MSLLLADYIELQRVHPVLAATVILAERRYAVVHGPYAKVLRVTEGFRTEARQRALVEQKKSMTMASLHLEGLAVDLAFLTPDRKTAIWDLEIYRAFNELMHRAFRQVAPDEASLVWGGSWRRLVDGVHWEVHGLDATLPVS